MLSASLSAECKVLSAEWGRRGSWELGVGGWGRKERGKRVRLFRS
uniref:Uncharacterized protein n=1 Tax=Desertifilum tharense IPPAS B-1220 TaxID=1781255 RepID=A0ACD5H0K5_9CYAN